LPAREAKAWARAAAAHAALHDTVAAAEALRRAYALDGSTARCEAYAEALCAIPAAPVATAAVKRAPGAPLRPGELASPTPHALPLLLAASAERSAKWALPRMAAITQLAALAACPETRCAIEQAPPVISPPAHVLNLHSPRRPQFLAPGAGLAALADWANDDSLSRLTLPEAMRSAWTVALRCRYESSSLLLPAAAGFAAVTRHASAERGGSAGSAALLDQPAVLRALCGLAARTPGCGASQEAVAAALRACLRAAEPASGAAASERRLLALLNAGADSALMLLARNFRDTGEAAKAQATTTLLLKLRHHPSHPDMRVPTD
jgi:hypothetical protein